MNSLIRFSARKIASAVMMPAFVAASAMAQLPSDSSLGITTGVTTGSVQVKVNDPGNHTWVLQSSPDLQTWSNVETWKVHNGSFSRSFTHDPIVTARLFYRSAFDS
ncbi:MAG TPA: hypothetical protein VK968_14230, partial [Roseimicrobium sp.]|nr:hypothetical protein [Roseimicrobium sp.]